MTDGEERPRERQFRADGVRVAYMLVRTMPHGEVKMHVEFTRPDPKMRPEATQMTHMAATADELRRLARWLERRADDLDAYLLDSAATA